MAATAQNMHLAIAAIGKTRQRRAFSALVPAATILMLLCSTALAQQKPQRALIDLKVNEEEKGEVLVYLSTSDALIRVSDLTQAGIKSVAGDQRSIQGEQYVSLASLSPDISYKINESTLVLSITAKPELLGTSTKLDLRGGKPAGIIYSNDSSAFLNYAFNVQNFSSWSAFAETGISLHGNLLYSSITRNAQGGFIRGLTNYTINDPERMTSWVAGDRFTNSPDPLGGGSFIGGLSYGTNYSLNPYFVRFPSANVAGALTTPSTIDIYVNGQLVREEQMSPGQF